MYVTVANLRGKTTQKERIHSLFGKYVIVILREMTVTHAHINEMLASGEGLLPQNKHSLHTHSVYSCYSKQTVQSLQK
jgi:hypothetical protein